MDYIAQKVTHLGDPLSALQQSLCTTVVSVTLICVKTAIYESYIPTGSLPSLQQGTTSVQQLSFPSDDVDPSHVASPSLGSQASHLLVGGSGAMAVPWKSMPSVQYRPELPNA